MRTKTCVFALILPLLALGCYKPPTEENIAGKWDRWKTEYPCRWELNPDGTYLKTYVIWVGNAKEGEAYHTKGTWKIVDENLVVHITAEETMPGRWRKLDTTLTYKIKLYTGYQLTLVQQPTRRSLPGTTFPDLEFRNPDQGFFD